MSRLAVVALTLVVMTGAEAQPAPEAKPWETWQPPEVVLPQPNAFDVYLRAFALKKQIDDQWRPVEVPGPPPAPAAPGGPPPPPPPPPGPEGPPLEWAVGHALRSAMDLSLYAMLFGAPPGAPPPMGLPLPVAAPVPLGLPAPAAHLQDPWPEGPFNLPLAERVTLYADVLTLVRQAFPLECRIPPPASLDEAMPYLSAFRSTTRRFSMEAGARREAGQCRGAADSALDALEMAQDAKTQHTLISYLIGIACEAIALASLDQTVPGLKAEDCKAALARLQKVAVLRPPLAEALSGEEVWGRLVFKGLMANPAGLREAFSPNPNRPVPEAELTKLIASMPQAWEMMGGYYEELQRAALLPYPQRPATLKPQSNQYLSLMVLGAERMLFKQTRADTLWSLHELQLAAQAYILDHGQPPSVLAELIPAYLAQIPQDPFTGRPLCGRVVNGKLTIYSVGPDGWDDGGRRLEHPVFNAEDNGDISMVVGAGTNRLP